MEARPIGFVAGVAFTLALLIACDQGAMQVAMMQDGGTSGASALDLLRAADAQTTPAAAGPTTMTAACDKTSTRGTVNHLFAEFAMAGVSPDSPPHMSAWTCGITTGNGLSCNQTTDCSGYALPEPNCKIAPVFWVAASKIIVYCGSAESGSLATTARIVVTQ